jgi:hypothetical protein
MVLLPPCPFSSAPLKSTQIRDGTWALGLLYSDIGESVLSAESTSKAYQLRPRQRPGEVLYHG